jgi:hypothetical protein
MLIKESELLLLNKNKSTCCRIGKLQDIFTFYIHACEVILIKKNVIVERVMCRYPIYTIIKLVFFFPEKMFGCNIKKIEFICIIPLNIQIKLCYFNRK